MNPKAAVLNRVDHRFYRAAWIWLLVAGLLTAVMAAPGGMVSANAGDLAKQPSLFPEDALRPVPAPIPESQPMPATRVVPLAERLWETVAMLVRDLGPRASHTFQEQMAAGYLAEQFAEWGYEVQVQEFETINHHRAARLVTHTPGHRSWMLAYPLDPGSVSPSAAYAISGKLAYLGHGAADDFDGVDLTGKIALVQRGGAASIDEKVELAAAAGARAAVVFNDNAGQGWLYFVDRILESTKIPAIGITNSQGRALVRALEAGTELEVEAQKEPVHPLRSRNVVAELNNDIAYDERLVIGAHFDTTPWSPGANDNASGMAAVMVLAQELVDADLPFDLAFVLFGAEETRLNGSNAYVMGLGGHGRTRTTAMINLDAIGAGRLSAIGSGEMLNLAARTAGDLQRVLGTARHSDAFWSDYVPFMVASIPWLHIFADDFSAINSPGDTIGRLQLVPMVQATELTLELVRRLAERQTGWETGPDDLARTRVEAPFDSLLVGSPQPAYGLPFTHRIWRHGG